MIDINQNVLSMNISYIVYGLQKCLGEFLTLTPVQYVQQ